MLDALQVGSAHGSLVHVAHHALGRDTVEQELGPEGELGHPEWRPHVRHLEENCVVAVAAYSLAAAVSGCPLIAGLGGGQEPADLLLEAVAEILRLDHLGELRIREVLLQLANRQDRWLTRGESIPERSELDL